MMRLIKLKCEDCHATNSVEVKEGQKILFCSFCGAKSLLDDETKSINLNIKKDVNIKKEDVARIKENERKIKVKELEVAEKQHERKSDMKIMVGCAIFFFLCIGILALMGLWESYGDRLGRGEPVAVSILIEFIDSSDEAIEVTINGIPLGVQSPGTIRTYYTELRIGSNAISFTVGDTEANRNFEVVALDYYFHFTVEEISRLLRNNILEVTFNLLTPSDVSALR
ncbi:MAG: hypothetical protein FWF78_08585 [Defluviitaleaceae bacterium]|nr:hypothetical protein [Defluviitaleaceae bacterium]